MPLSDGVSVHSQTIVFPLSYYVSVLTTPPPGRTVQSHSTGITWTLFVSSVIVLTLVLFWHCRHLLSNGIVTLLRRGLFGPTIQDRLMITLRLRNFSSSSHFSNLRLLSRASKSFRRLTQRKQDSAIILLLFAFLTRTRMFHLTICGLSVRTTMIYVRFMTLSILFTGRLNIKTTSIRRSITVPILYRSGIHFRHFSISNRGRFIIFLTSRFCFNRTVSCVCFRAFVFLVPLYTVRVLSAY